MMPSKSSSNEESEKDSLIPAHETELFLSTFVRALFPLMACSALSIGLKVRWLYDLSGADQSRTPAVVRYAFFGFLAACGLSILGLLFLPRLTRKDPIRSPFFRTGIFALDVVILLGIVVGAVAFRQFAMIILGVVAFVYPVFCALKLAVVSKSVRWRVMSLYACLYLPFVWLFTNDVFRNAIKQGSWIFVPIVTGAPSLAICYFTSFLLFSPALHPGVVLTSVIPTVVTGLEIMVGLWVIQLGARRALAYLIVMYAISIITSFLLHALVRA